MRQFGCYFLLYVLVFLLPGLVLTFRIVEKNIKAYVKLEKEEEQAEKALKAAMAKLARIRSQKRLLKKKGNKLFTYRMQSQEESSKL